MRQVSKMNQMVPAPGQARRSLGTSWVDPLAGAAADGFASAPKPRANENPRRCGERNFNQLEFMRLREHDELSASQYGRNGDD